MMFNRSKEQEKKEAKKEKICSFRFRIVLVSFSRLYFSRDFWGCGGCQADTTGDFGGRAFTGGV